MSRDTYEHRHTFIEESGPFPDFKEVLGDKIVHTPLGQTFICTTLNLDMSKIKPVVMKGLDNGLYHKLSDKSIVLNYPDPNKNSISWEDK
jgi:hypothetical protein